MFAGKEEIICYLLYKREDDVDNDGDGDEGGEVCGGVTELP